VHLEGSKTSNLMYVHVYLCLAFVNGLIPVMPKSVHTYMHHKRKSLCIAQRMVDLWPIWVIKH
jgi:hypothetical protein